MNDKVIYCSWVISINGKELDLERKSCISSIEIDEECDGSDSCTISICDPEFKFIEDNIFVEEATVNISAYLDGGENTVNFSGYISAIDLDFPSEGYPTMSIYCIDNSHIMNRKKKKRSWSNTTNAEVVKAIAQEYGFKCIVEQGYSFKTEDTISQSGSTDIEFCESLADDEREPFMCKLVGDTLYYVKKGLLKDPVATLKYKEYPYDIISFSPKINKETQQEETSSADINTDTKLPETSVADDSTPRDTQGESVSTSDTVTNMVYSPTTRNWDTVSSSELPSTDDPVDFNWDSINWDDYKE